MKPQPSATTSILEGVTVEDQRTHLGCAIWGGGVVISFVITEYHLERIWTPFEGAGVKLGKAHSFPALYTSKPTRFFGMFSFLCTSTFIYDMHFEIQKAYKISTFIVKISNLMCTKAMKGTILAMKVEVIYTFWISKYMDINNICTPIHTTPVGKG